MKEEMRGDHQKNRSKNRSDRRAIESKDGAIEDNINCELLSCI